MVVPPPAASSRRSCFSAWPRSRRPRPRIAASSSHALQTQLPNFSGTLPPSADMTTAGNDNYLYVLTQWGFARGSLANPANPGPYIEVRRRRRRRQRQRRNHSDHVRLPPGVEHDGRRRVLRRQRFPAHLRLAAPPSELDLGTGRAARPGKREAGSSFGQQINLPSNVPQASRIAAVRLPDARRSGTSRPRMTACRWRT